MKVFAFQLVVSFEGGRSIVVREIIPEAERSPPRPKKELSPPPQVMRRRTRSPRSRSRSRSPRRRERSPGSPRRRVATRYRLMVCGIPPECDEFDIQDVSTQSWQLLMDNLFQYLNWTFSALMMVFVWLFLSVNFFVSIKIKSVWRSR